jgi:hypothetical protein
MNNVLYVQYPKYDVLINLDLATSIQRLSDRIIIHFDHPDQTFSILDDQDEYDIVNNYFDNMRANRFRIGSIKKELSNGGN